MVRLWRWAFPWVKGAMVVVVVPEIEQFIFQIDSRPEHCVIQIFASNAAEWAFPRRDETGNIGDDLDFCHLQNLQIGLPLVEFIKRIVVGIEVLWQPALPANGAVRHATECDTIDRTGMDAEACRSRPSLTREIPRP
jgi:hypothetical protein